MWTPKRQHLTRSAAVSSRNSSSSSWWRQFIISSIIFVIILFFQSTQSLVPRYSIEVLSGNPYMSTTYYDGVMATDAILSTPSNVLLYNDELYISDTVNNMVRKVSKNGTLTTLVGVGTSGNNEDDGLLGVDTQLNSPNGLAISPNGQLLFIADTGNRFVRVLDLKSMICTIFKTYTSTGVLDTMTKPIGVTVSNNWNVYITDDKYVKKANYNTRLVTIIAGGGSGSYKDNVVPTTVSIPDPKFIHNIPDGSATLLVFTDSTAARFITDTESLQSTTKYSIGVSAGANVPAIFPVSSTVFYYSSPASSSIIYKLENSGYPISTAPKGDTGKYTVTPMNTASFNEPIGLHGNSSVIYIADSKNNCIRKYDVVNDRVSTVVGFKYQPSFEGVYALSVYADLKIQKLLVTYKDQIIYLDTDNRVRMITSEGRIKTLIGSEYASKYSTCATGNVALECSAVNANSISSAGDNLILSITGTMFSYNLSTISGLSVITLSGSVIADVISIRSMAGSVKDWTYYITGGSGDLRKRQVDDTGTGVTLQSSLSASIFNLVNIGTDQARICYIQSGIITCFNETNLNDKIILPMPSGETKFTSVALTNTIVYASTSNRIYAYSVSDYSSPYLIAGLLPINVNGQTFDYTGYNSDYILATNAILNDISNLQVSPNNGNLYFVSGGTLIRRVANGFVSTVAGISPLHKEGIMPMSISRDPTRKIAYFIDSNTHVKMMDESSGIITPLTYPISPNTDPQNITLPLTFLRAPQKTAGQLLAYSSYDNSLYVADYCRIISINVTTGSYKLVTGTMCGESADNTLAINSRIQTPGAMTVESKTGDLYFSIGPKIKKIEKKTGLLTTLFGSGTLTLSNNITSLIVSDDTIYLADISSSTQSNLVTFTRNVRQITISTSNMTTLDSSATASIGVTAVNTTAVACFISLDKNGDVFIIDPFYYYISKYIKGSGKPPVVTGKQYGKGFNGRYNSQGKNASFKVLTSAVSIDNGLMFTEIADKSGLIRKIIAHCDGNSTLESSGGSCTCNEGYTGDSCNLFVCYGLASSSLDVCSGNGSCIDVNICKCKDGFEGSACSIAKATSTSPTGSSSLGVILPAVLVPVLVILIIIVIIIVVVIIVIATKKKKNGKNKLGETTTDFDEVPMTDLPSDMSVILSSSLTRSVSSSTNEEENLFTRYQDIVKIGQGAFGSVFKVRDTKDGDKTKAVKVLKFNSVSDLNMIMKEGAQLTNAKHDHILKVNDYFITNDNLLCIDMDYYEKGDLSQFTKTDCPETIVKQILYQLCDALSYVHGTLSMIHRDIKPTNIFVKEFDGTKVNVILADFGLAKQAQESANNSYAGTPLYMSPELGLGGKYYPNSDTYSLGVTIYQIMTKDVTTSISHLLLNDTQNAEAKLRDKMKNAKMDYSDQLIDLVIRMLDKDSLTRPNAQDILSESYFRR